MKPILSLISPEDMNFPLSSSTVRNTRIISALSPCSPSSNDASSDPNCSLTPFHFFACLSFSSASFVLSVPPFLLRCKASLVKHSRLAFHLSFISFHVFLSYLPCVLFCDTRSSWSTTVFFPSLFNVFLSLFFHRACHLSSLSPLLLWYMIQGISNFHSFPSFPHRAYRSLYYRAFHAFHRSPLFLLSSPCSAERREADMNLPNCSWPSM